jgi:hypothetical protein
LIGHIISSLIEKTAPPILIWWCIVNSFLKFREMTLFLVLVLISLWGMRWSGGDRSTHFIRRTKQKLKSEMMMDYFIAQTKHILHPINSI